MDEFGDITVDDLLDLKESFEDEIETLMEYIRETHRKHTLTSGVRGQVLKQAKSNSSEEQKYGVGAVMVRIPRLSLVVSLPGSRLFGRMLPAPRPVHDPTSSGGERVDEASSSVAVGIDGRQPGQQQARTGNLGKK